MNLNKVFLLGRLTNNPQVRVLSSGRQMATFSIATNRVYKDKQGRNQSEVTYHNILAWGRNAEIVSTFLSKGSLVLIEGRIQTRSYTGSDGQNKKRTDIICERLQLGPRLTNQVPSSSSGQTPSASSGQASSADSRQENSELPEIELEEDSQEIKEGDLPF